MSDIKTRARETKQLLYTACTALDNSDTTPKTTSNAVHTARQLARLLHDLLDKKDIAPPLAAHDLISAAQGQLKTVIGQIRHTSTRDNRVHSIDPLAWAAIQSAALILNTLERDIK